MRGLLNQTVPAAAKTRRTEIISVRLDPKLKYLAELAARKQRRSLSGYIEWMLEESLSRVELEEASGGNDAVTVADAQRQSGLWEVDEADRVVKLALHFPDLLTFEEQLIWRLVRDNGLLWRGGYRHGEWSWTVDERSMLWDRLREHWETFKQVAAGELTADHLPSWAVKKTQPGLDEDIPF